MEAYVAGMAGKLAPDEKRVLCSDPSCVNNIRLDTGADTWLLCEEATGKKFVLQSLPGTQQLLTMISLIRKVPPTTDLHRVLYSAPLVGVTITRVGHDHGTANIERTRTRTIAAHCPDQNRPKPFCNGHHRCSTCGKVGHNRKNCAQPTG